MINYRKSKILNHKLALNELMVVCFFAFIVGLYAPFEMYVTNIAEFWFSVKILLSHCLPVTLCMILAMVLILANMKDTPRKVVLLLLFWMEISIYVQGTFLNIDIGQLTGISFASSQYIKYFARDAIVWAVILIIIIVLYKKKTSYYVNVTEYLPLFLLITLTMTGGVLFSKEYYREEIKDDTAVFNSGYGITTLGDQENIVVFVLDMFDSTYMDTIETTFPEVLKEFDGFVKYDNYVGGYATTAYSLAYMNSGKYFRNEMILDDFVNEQESYVDVLIDEGYDIANYGAYGFPGRLYKQFSNYIKGDVKVKNTLKYLIHIYEMGAFRYAPNVFKVALINFHDKLSSDMTVDSEYKLYSDSNVDIAELFDSTPMAVESGKFFKMIYAKGVHYPYENDEDLNRVKANEEHPIECAVGAMKMVEKYLNWMRKMGVYDNTTVIITADHGYFSDYGQESISKPVMLIKPKNSHGNIRTDISPVSHEDFPATIVDIATGKKINKFGKSIFAYDEDENRDRYYYHYYLKEKGDSRRLIEYSVLNDSNAQDAFKLTGKEYTIHGDVIDHFKYCETCKTGNHFGKGNCWHEKSSDYPDDKSFVENVIGN